MLQKSPSRQTVYAGSAIAATSQPLAAAAGLFALREGGTAMDAAIAMAATLTVVEPTGCGVGSDVMALIYENNGLSGYIGAGRTPKGFDVERFNSVRLNPRGWASVTVPAAPLAWVDLSARYGRLGLPKLLEPAIKYAREGFPLSPLTALGWKRAVDEMRHNKKPEHSGFLKNFCPPGFQPEAGAHFSSTDLASTLERVAATKGEDFYTGSIAERIDHFSRQTGGWLRGEDLSSHSGEWVAPESTEFRGYTVYELPPPTQGGIALLALGLMNQLGCSDDPAENEHRSIESIKRAFISGLSTIGDGNEARAWLKAAMTRSTFVSEAKGIVDVASPGPVDARLEAGTVYLAAADVDGMMVSLIQSNFMGFGSHVVVPGTGISLANRAGCFSSEADHPNAPHAQRRPFNTIIPGFLADKDGVGIGPFGVMGGYMQPQGHVQVLKNIIDRHMDPQMALDSPRWRLLQDRTVLVEPDYDKNVVEYLRHRRHEIHFAQSTSGFGRGQVIFRVRDGYVAGSDGRADGAALGY